MNRRATKQIYSNIRDEFKGIRGDIKPHLAPDVTVDYARELLARHIPVLVVGRGQLLLDTLLNYLMEDAVEALVDSSTETKNDFYTQDLRARLKGAFNLEPQTLHFSFDPRVLAGGVAAGGTLAAGGLFVSIILADVVPRIIAGLATLVATAFAFRVAHSAGTASARRALEADVSAYLVRSEGQISEWLSGVERAFIEAFDQFTAERGIRQGGTQ